jgi:hypothetical protein
MQYSSDWARRSIPRAEDYGIWPVPADVPQAHVTPPLGRVTVYADRVQASSGKRGRPGPGGRRGKVVGFSSPARRRLMARLACVRLVALFSSFVTITYPDEALRDDWSAVKRDLFALRKRLMRSPFGIVGGVWRLEPQPRRSAREKRYIPHFHFILAHTAPLGEDFKLWLAQAWYEIVASGLEKHRRRGVDVEALDSRRKVRNYISKYVAKVSDKETPYSEAWGRCWGMFGQLDTDPYADIIITENEYVLLRRLYRNWLKSRRSLRYAKYLRCAETSSILALGVESGDYLTIFRMLDAIRPGIDHIGRYLVEGVSYA